MIFPTQIERRRKSLHRISTLRLDNERGTNTNNKCFWKAIKYFSPTTISVDCVSLKLLNDPSFYPLLIIQVCFLLIVNQQTHHWRQLLYHLTSSGFTYQTLTCSKKFVLIWSYYYFISQYWTRVTSMQTHTCFLELASSFPAATIDTCIGVCFHEVPLLQFLNTWLGLLQCKPRIPRSD